MRSLQRFGRMVGKTFGKTFGKTNVGLLSLATWSFVACATDNAPSTGAAEQEVIASPLPPLNLVLHAKTALTIGPFTSVLGDVGSSGANGSVLFDVAATQGFGSFNVAASTVTVNTQASVGFVFGNDITVIGSAFGQTLGFDPAQMPQMPAVTAAAAGATNVSTKENQKKQLCPGQYGAISLGVNSTLNLNGGVYQIGKLTLADGARLEPSEPVVILVTGGVTTGIGSAIVPSAQSLDPLTAANIRIEAGGAIKLGNSNQLRAQLLATGNVTAGTQLNLTGTLWARAISIGANSFVAGDGPFLTSAATVPPPCNDHSACTVDTCVGGGTAAGFCRNAPLPAGASCGDGNACNGAELCDGAGTCQPGAIQPVGTSCPDGDRCNGDETCDGFGTCEPGAPPIVDDNNPCTADTCDAELGVVHTPLADGTTCNGTGVCTAGACIGGAGPSSGAFSYTASNTSSATQNTTNLDLEIVAGQRLDAGTCGVLGASGSGDTYLRLIDPFGNEVAFNDDSCGVLSFLEFTATTTGTYHIHAGCFSSNTCSGTVAYTLTGL